MIKNHNKKLKNGYMSILSLVIIGLVMVFVSAIIINQSLYYSLVTQTNNTEVLADSYANAALVNYTSLYVTCEETATICDNDELTKNSYQEAKIIADVLADKLDFSYDILSSPSELKLNEELLFTVSTTKKYFMPIANTSKEITTDTSITIRYNR